MTRVLQVRRHADRKTGGGSQLSQRGVERARRIGADLGRFAVVAAAPSPRARETAIAFGCAVDHDLVPLAADPGLFDEHGSQWFTADAPFAAMERFLGHGGPQWRWAIALTGLWRDLLAPLPDGASALYVGESGELEAGVVAATPEVDRTGWGGLLGPCEGFELSFDGTRFTTARTLRES